MDKNIKVNQYIGAYLSFQNFFGDDECNALIDLFEDKKENNFKNIILDETKELFKNENTFVVNCETRFINSGEKHIIEELSKYINEVNKYFNFDISYIKDLQIVKCSEMSEFDWRTDIQSNSTRKISFIVFLSDLKDYDGGQITFSMIEPKVDEVFQKKGTILFFPSIRPYMSELIKKGNRYTLIGWVYGNAFK